MAPVVSRVRRRQCCEIMFTLPFCLSITGQRGDTKRYAKLPQSRNLPNTGVKRL